MPWSHYAVASYSLMKACTCPATFYSKLTVGYIKPTHRNYEKEVLLPYSEFKNCIRSTLPTASFCGYTQDLTSHHMFQMFIDMLSLFILV